MYYYHITKPEYVFSILTQGLIPNYKHGLTGGGPRKDIVSVWLTDNPQYIIDTQAGDSWPYRVLLVDCTGLEIKPYKVFVSEDPNGSIAPYEFLCDACIEPNRIKLCTGGREAQCAELQIPKTANSILAPCSNYSKSLTI